MAGAMVSMRVGEKVGASADWLVGTLALRSVACWAALRAAMWAVVSVAMLVEMMEFG